MVSAVNANSENKMHFCDDEGLNQVLGKIQSLSISEKMRFAELNKKMLDGKDDAADENEYKMLQNKLQSWEKKLEWQPARYKKMQDDFKKIEQGMDELKKLIRQLEAAEQRVEPCGRRALKILGSTFSFAKTAIFHPVNTLTKYCRRSHQA